MNISYDPDDEPFRLYNPYKEMRMSNCRPRMAMYKAFSPNDLKALKPRRHKKFRSTYIHSAGVNSYKIRYYNTDIIQIDEDGCTTLNTGGFETNTTKIRMNYYLPPKCHIYQHKHVWYLKLADGVVVDYKDNIVLTREGILHAKHNRSVEEDERITCF